MTVGYTKLFSEIVMSTVWREPNHVRIVWITMLALKDRWHVVSASLPGLADAARVTMPECEDALLRLSSPDAHSRTKEFEGRRIEPCDSGWTILNGEKYRNKMSLDERREYQRIKQKEYRDRVKSCIQTSQRFTHTEEDTEAEADTKADTEALPVVVLNKTDTVVVQKHDASVRDKNKKLREDSKLILQFLNQKTGKAFREVDSNLKPIESILKSGVDLQDMKTVTMRKVRDWGSDPKMNQYLRPSTLYRRSNFEQYLGQTILPEAEHG